MQFTFETHVISPQKKKPGRETSSFTLLLMIVLFSFSFSQSSPDENESQTDVSFRHITEITILTVQLIVEFAKGLPAFTKIPQEDQITLLKVS